MSSTLYDGAFRVETVDPGRYTKVSRVIATTSGVKDVKITIDINTELFSVSKEDLLSIVLAKSLSIGDASDADMFTANGSWRPPKPNQHSLMDDYDYVMYGTVYKFEEGSDDKISVFCSFGGLLMCLEGNYRTLSGLKQENLYILIRK